MKLIFSFNKTGYEAECYADQLRRASNEWLTIIPFNHVSYLDPGLYWDAWSLDRLYQTCDPRLMRMYEAFEQLVSSEQADAMVVFNCPPYHPDFLRKLTLYKTLYSGDDPDSTYKRNIPYLHAYDHVFYLDPAYSADMDMREKMRYCGMSNATWVPMGVSDYEFDASFNEAQLFACERDIDIVYVGHCFPQKAPLLVKLKRAFGKRFCMRGNFRLKHNLYMNLRHGYGGWVRPVSIPGRLRLYQRSKLGINIHWNNYGLGNQRLYLLPANGVMQLCDCADHVGRVYEVDREIVSYRNADELIMKIEYYLEHDAERERIAVAGFRRTMRDYRLAHVLRQAAMEMAQVMSKDWRCASRSPGLQEQ